MTLPPASVVRFWAKVDKSGDCWLWTAAVDPRGYGAFGGPNHRRVFAHRVAYELLKGPIPQGLELDHLCRQPSCVNPDHLEPVTHAENVRRGECGSHQRAKTHCPHGHEYTPENTVHTKEGWRTCRTCKRISNRKAKARAKAAAKPLGSGRPSTTWALT